MNLVLYHTSVSQIFMKKLQLASLNEVLTVLDQLEKSENVSSSGWSVYKVLQHCAQTIDYSMSGYPKYKPVWFRNTIGKIVFSKFFRQGYMSHDLAAPVPGSPLLTVEGNLQEGIALLRGTIARFLAFEGTLKPHLVFGQLTKAQYDKYFAMHVADHFSEITY